MTSLEMLFNTLSIEYSKQIDTVQLPKGLDKCDFVELMKVLVKTKTGKPLFTENGLNDEFFDVINSVFTIESIGNRTLLFKEL